MITVYKSNIKEWSLSEAVG